MKYLRLNLILFSVLACLAVEASAGPMGTLGRGMNFSASRAELPGISAASNRRDSLSASPALSTNAFSTRTHQLKSTVKNPIIAPQVNSRAITANSISPSFPKAGNDLNSLRNSQAVPINTKPGAVSAGRLTTPAAKPSLGATRNSAAFSAVTAPVFKNNLKSNGSPSFGAPRHHSAVGAAKQGAFPSNGKPLNSVAQTQLKTLKNPTISLVPARKINTLGGSASAFGLSTPKSLRNAGPTLMPATAIGAGKNTLRPFASNSLKPINQSPVSFVKQPAFNQFSRPSSINRLPQASSKF